MKKDKTVEDKIVSIENKEPSMTIAKTVARTLISSVFIIVGALAALSLRNDLKLPSDFNAIVGSLLLAFVLGTMFTLVYKSQK